MKVYSIPENIAKTKISKIKRIGILIILSLVAFGTLILVLSTDTYFVAIALAAYLVGVIAGFFLVLRQKEMYSRMVNTIYRLANDLLIKVDEKNVSINIPFDEITQIKRTTTGIEVETNFRYVSITDLVENFEELESALKKAANNK